MKFTVSRFIMRSDADKYILSEQLYHVPHSNAMYRRTKEPLQTIFYAQEDDVVKEHSQITKPYCPRPVVRLHWKITKCIRRNTLPWKA